MPQHNILSIGPKSVILQLETIRHHYSKFRTCSSKYSIFHKHATEIEYKLYLRDTAIKIYYTENIDIEN